jgi:hypothetical protein
MDPFQFSLVHQIKRVVDWGRNEKEGLSFVLIGQRRNANHGIQEKNGVTHLRWKK